ncbi:hypothetical protein [Kitasatospora sp. McL0602]|uniref:hypothetical protein n=1 Tax=Kitasatospora sp. McL0602 TaxID=3439530 RepID=UPI003F88CA70
MRDEFVALLREQVDYHEGQDHDGTWNNVQKFSEQTPGLEWSDGEPWCATFQAWAAHQRGIDSLWPMTAGCRDAVDWWQRHGRWSHYPVLGGPFYLGPGGGTHTGTVYAYDGDTIYTVEGNTNNNGSANGDGVYLRQRPRRGPGSPYGYGVPAWPEGTISADPALGGTPAAEVGTPTTPAPPVIEEDPMAAFTEADIRRFIREEASGVTVRDANAYAVHYWLLNMLTGTVPPAAAQQPWANLVPQVHAALAQLPASTLQQLKDAVAAALRDGTVHVQVDVNAPAHTA